MSIRRFTVMTLLALGVSACAAPDMATRETPIDGPVLSTPAIAFNVKDVRVTVPKTLKVSEANVFYPFADIVWRGDPLGDRYQQIKAMFDDGMGRGTAKLTKGRAVFVDITVRRFHALTEKTRATIGGSHSIEFDITVVDAKSGEVVVPTRKVSTELVGFGGRRAIEAERAGQTQKVRITDYLAQLIQRELTVPVSAPATAALPARQQNTI